MPGERAVEHRALAERVWRQVFELFVRTRGQRDHVLQRYRLSPNDAKTLCTMEVNAAKPMRALAELCCTDASNATWVVDRLENRHLVERRSVQGDRRVKLVGLTTRGVKTRQAILEAMHEPPLEVLALERGDLEALARILAKIPILVEPGEPTLAVPAAATPPRPRKRAPRRARRAAQPN